MIEIKLMGMWIFADAWYSIHTYWGKETWKEQYIRVIRLVLSAYIIVVG